MGIETFAQRQKAEYIYNTYFNQDSEHHIGFGMLDTIMFYGAMSEKDFETLNGKFEEVGEKLFNKIKEFDKKVLLNKI